MTEVFASRSSPQLDGPTIIQNWRKEWRSDENQAGMLRPGEKSPAEELMDQQSTLEHGIYGPRPGSRNELWTDGHCWATILAANKSNAETPVMGTSGVTVIRDSQLPTTSLGASGRTENDQPVEIRSGY
ncbi:hypothetical protein N7539_003387 [Penicillium diatomitis]|uniref:Uncharacterized protein n=1 Tax=Penicillium diatomitis TaxID=2819901 RepID=A0A9W9XD15_9EURO|nr:uncharacterized protein N7539_003387 [Penicillium diatomitis]KAJ5488497.1 hypothetical protein N7539_003387 [Penicillium diatomitis]